MSNRHSKVQSFKVNGEPGTLYDVPGFFIKDWNMRSLIHTHNIPMALFWFQHVHLIPNDVQKQIASYAQETGIERNRML